MRMHRERARLPQYELAKLSGVTQKTIWALEHDKNNGSVSKAGSFGSLLFACGGLDIRG